ncbi:MAG: phage adaptor protein [Mycobacteriaceae bacterium]
MSFTLANLKSAVQAHGYGTDTTGDQTTFAQIALRRLYGQRRWRFLRKTDSTLTIAVAGSTVSLAAITDRQTGKLEAVRLVPAVAGDTLTLEELPWEELRELDAADSDTGFPRYYARTDANTIQVWPRSDATYTVQIDYISLPTVPSADGDTVVWPDEYQDVLVWAIIRALAFRQRDWFSAPSADAEYAQRLDEMIQAQSLNGSNSPARMGHWDGWDRVAR